MNFLQYLFFQCDIVIFSTYHSIFSRVILHVFNFIHKFERAVVEWFDTLGSGAKGRRKVVRSRPDFAVRRLENSVNQAVNGYLFPSQRKENDGLRLSSAVPMIQWASSPHGPYGYYAITERTSQTD